MNAMKIRKLLSLFAPILLCLCGLFFNFFHFWHGFDAISGDTGDTRFNTLVLEHTWLWITKIHTSLFDSPIFFPHLNAYAYSDYLFSSAPIYWLARTLSFDPLLSFQSWMIISCLLNYAAFFALARKSFRFSIFVSAIGAYVFSFALPRMTHLEHAQLIPQYFIVVSAMGAMQWFQNPRSRLAPFLFFGFAVLQFLNAFYFFWFWIWSLSMIALFIATKRGRRESFKIWFKQTNPQATLVAMGASFAASGPFLYHYILASRELGSRSWVVISEMVPRAYSWLSLPKDHWEWFAVPMKDWINALPMGHEHYLSFGLLSWLTMFAALFYQWRMKTWRILAIPTLAMFAFTLTSGRFSTWVFISYLFPGGGVIRAVSRIQIFMLLFWSLLMMGYLRYLFSNSKKSKWLAIGIIIAFFAENTYISNWSFSRLNENQRMQTLAAQLAPDCEVIVHSKALAPHEDLKNNDAVWIAYLTHRSTINGYSGNQPSAYREILELNASTTEKLAHWFSVHPIQTKKVCIYD
jgi:hypothetical protein